MRRRLQFSLLGLLLLTAAIAVGVKLWHGPHHVVERPSPNLEDEFTYTRRWDGTKIVDGPRVLRYFQADGSLDRASVHFYRRGVRIDYAQTVLSASSNFEQLHPRTDYADDTLLTPDELQSMRDSVEHYSEYILAEGRLPIVIGNKTYSFDGLTHTTK